MENIDHNGTDEVVCPWCGYEHCDSWELSDDGDFECYKCEKSFTYVRNIYCDYSTTRKKCDSSCKYKIADHSPSIHHGKNWTSYQCEICHDEIILTGKIAKDGKPYIIKLETNNE